MITQEKVESFSRNYRAYLLAKGLAETKIGLLFGPDPENRKLPYENDEKDIREALALNPARTLQFNRYKLCLTIAGDPSKMYDHVRQDAVAESEEIKKSLFQ